MTSKLTSIRAIFVTLAVAVFAITFISSSPLYAQNPPNEPVSQDDVSLAVDNLRLAPENVATMTATPITPAVPCPSCLKDTAPGTLDTTPLIDVPAGSAASSKPTGSGKTDN